MEKTLEPYKEEIMEENKDSFLKKLFKDIVTWILFLLFIAFSFGLIMLPFMSIGFLCEGYPKIGLICFIVFLAEILVIVICVKRSKKKKLAKEAEYRAQNVVEYESLGGWLGVLKFEQDKLKNTIKLKRGFPAIFDKDEKPILIAYGVMIEARDVERIADRLTSDREKILDGIARAYNKYFESDTAATTDLKNLKLSEISIEDDGTTVACIFNLPENTDYIRFIDVSYTIDKEGYKYFID